jgi:hypothetical protein
MHPRPNSCLHLPVKLRLEADLAASKSLNKLLRSSCVGSVDSGTTRLVACHVRLSTIQGGQGRLSAGPNASRFAYPAYVVGRAAVVFILIGW